VLDGAVALCFVITGTAATLNTPRAVRGRAGAVTAIYASIVRGGAILGLGAIATAGGTLPAFALLAGCFVATAAVAAYSNIKHADSASARSRN